MHLYAFHIFSIHSLTGGHKVALVNSAEVSTETHKYLQYLFLISFRYMPWSGTAGSNGCLFLGFWGSFIFVSIVTVPITFPSVVNKDLFSSHPHLHLLPLALLSIAILNSVNWYLIVVLIWISLLFGWTLFHTSIGHPYVFFGKHLFRYFAHF